LRTQLRNELARRARPFSIQAEKHAADLNPRQAPAKNRLMHVQGAQAWPV